MWFTGNVKIQVDDMKAWKIVWQGKAGQGNKRSQIFWSVISSIGIGIGIWIMTKMDFALSPTTLGSSWWGVVLILLSLGLVYMLKGKAAQAVKNRIIREPDFYTQAQEWELFALDEY